MPEYDFTLKFQLSSPNQDTSVYLDQLYESGCDDALVGTGQPGSIALNFTREAISASAAIESAINNVKAAIADATFISASLDLVGITDIANLLGCSRQNVQKLLKEHDSFSPTPIYQGAQSIWHLATVLTWLLENKDYPVDSCLLDIAVATMALNLTRQQQILKEIVSSRFTLL